MGKGAGTRRQMFKVARSQIGYHEGPNNDTKYGTYCGLPNQPWCAMFLKWVADHAGVPLPGWSAYTPAWKENAISRHLFHRYHPQRGDIVFFDFAPGIGPVEHVGIVTNGRILAWLGFLRTIEGNTWSGVGAYQGEGDGVYRRTRFRPDVAGYATVRYKKGRRHA